MATPAEDYLPPKPPTIASLAGRYLCNGIRSVCWECECADHCEYGRIFCRLLRERVKAQKQAWRGYELAVRPLITAKARQERKIKQKHKESARRSYHGKRTREGAEAPVSAAAEVSL